MKKSNIYVIAEAGVNHNGCEKRAFELVDAAIESGVDAVKFQTFKAERLVTEDAQKADYQKDATGAEESQFAMLKKLELSYDAFRKLALYCQQKGIDFLSTAFDSESLKFLIELDMPFLKIPSGEMTNAPFVLEHARTSRQVIMSTGMASLSEIKTALSVLAYGFLNARGEPSLNDLEKAFQSPEGQSLLKQKVTLLHCTTEYPAPWDEINLNVLNTFKEEFDLPIGYSDHTQGICISLATIPMGAVVIEKHFTLDKSLPGPDHQASLDPLELAEMVAGIRHIERAMGVGTKEPTSSEIKNKLIARKSLVAKTDITAGEVFSYENLTTLRPGSGISPEKFWSYLNKESSKAYKAGDLINE